MPWCERCSRMVPDEDLGDGGRCPTCGDVIDEPRHVPWHFKAMIGATAVYLLYRLGQGIDWLVHHI